MANLTKTQTDALLAKGVNNVAIIAYRKSSSNPANVNLMYAEVIEGQSSDGGAFNALMGGSPNQVKYAWAPALATIAADMFGIKDAKDDTQTCFIENPKIGEKFLKVRRMETHDSDKGKEVINPSTGEVKVDANGEQVYRIEGVALADSFNQVFEDQKIVVEAKAKAEADAKVPFDITKV